MEMKHIVYVAKADLPYTAPGIRIDAIMRLLESVGYSFTIICDREFDEATEAQAEKLNAKIVLQSATRVEVQYQNRIYVYKTVKKINKLQALCNLFELRFANNLFATVKEYSERSKAMAVILYNDTYALTKRLLRFAPKKGVKLFADVTEWYEPQSRSVSVGERMVPKLVDKRIRVLDKRLNGIISISQYFHQYYTSNGAKSLFIPPLMPTFYLQPKREDIPTIVYAGSPGGKDLLLPALKAVDKINMKGIKLRLKLIGINEADLRRLYGEDDFIEKGIEAYGRLPHADALAIIDECDFGILFRKNKRYAKAGFSTKLAECMSRSVPMICNEVGGCESVIEDGVDGFIVEDATEQTIEEAFIKVSKLPLDERTKIKERAYLKAEKLFNGVKYIQGLKRLIEE